MRIRITYLISYLFCLFFSGCNNVPESPEMSSDLPCIFPDYLGVTIPDGIAPLNFCIDGADRLDVIVTGGKEGELHVNGDYACFDIDDWHAITSRNRGDSLLVTVRAFQDKKWIQYKPFTIYVSEDSLGEWGVTYRLIPPGYESYGLMGIYQRDLSNFEETPILENSNIDGQCVNCHTPNCTNPEQFTMHVRGNNGATVVRNDGQLEVLAARNEELGGSMVYPFWHPTGKYIAYSTNQTRQNFHQLNDLRVEVYDETSDVIVYHVESREIILDSIVSQKDRLENYPVFSPDGKTLYYCEAQRVDSVWKTYQQIKYNICRIGFNPNTGTLEGTVDTVVNARSMGKSAVMPRVSYDGRYLLYTLCDYGCFPIWHPEADLWMMNLESGESFPLDKANSTDAESFHNWSLNSRWIVFTSRRDDGLYTHLYLAHIREDGRADKAFCLPQYNPQEYDAETIWSFNTPDFSIAPICLEKKNLYNQILSGNREQTKLTRKMPPSLSSR